MTNFLQEDGQQAIWAPPKMWTAWPAPERHLPAEGLFKDEKNEDDKFTFRRNEKQMPSSELEEELSATILRQAKDRFTKRNRPTSTSVRPSIESAEKAEESDEGESAEESSTENSEAESASEVEKMNLDDTPITITPTKRKAVKTYEPVISANDELSHTILKPSARHILSKLDKTLTILHNTRVAGLSYLSDSSETESESDAPSPRKRGRGRPRLPPGQRSSSSASESGKRRGRPKLVHEPQKDESPHEMNLRLARKYHRRLPATEEERKEAGFQEWLRQGDERIEQEQKRRRAASQDAENREGSDADDAAVDRKLQRWGLRDWSDVVGAASLAGFPREVVERTTRRCANLFGQGMAITQLDEMPVSKGPGFSTTTYRPERIRLSASAGVSSSEDEGPDALEALTAEATLSQRRMASRQASLARSSREASNEPRGRKSPHTPTPAASPSSQSHSRSRSRSRSSAGILFCPVSSCNRAATGFARRTNLKRHMRLVHPGHDENSAVEYDSEEEVVGAVHVDGFLKTINPGKGWRGEDVVKRKRRWDARPATPIGSPRREEGSE